MLKLAQKINKSVYMDMLGLFIILAVAFHHGFHKTQIPLSTIWYTLPTDVMFPLGIVSIISSVCSVMATRFISKIHYIGNIIGTANIFLACFIDAMLGNKGAIITYPVTFILTSLAIYTWRKYKDKVNDPRKYKLVIFSAIPLAFLISFSTNYIGFREFNNMYFIVSIVFGLSLLSNFSNVLKIPTQWTFWIMYNVVQLIKAVMQGNFANVGKYIYYLINSTLANIVWIAKALADNRKQDE